MLEPLAEGEYYFDDLVGCRLEEETTGREIGSIAEIFEPPGGVLLLSVVDADQKEMLVPFAMEICRAVDVGAKRVVARLPEGMEDLKT